MSAAQAASDWRRNRAARRERLSDDVASLARAPQREVEIPEGVALVGQDKEAAELLFRELGKGYVEQLEELQRDGALGSDAMRTMHEKAETDVKIQCARAGARISDILRVVTSYMSRVHEIVMGVAEQQRTLFAKAVHSIVDDGPARLHMLFTDIAKHQIQKRMEQAERSMDGTSTFYQAARQAGVIDSKATESEFWQQQIQEAQESARQEAEKMNEQLREQLSVQAKKNEQMEEKIQHIVDAHDKKTATAMEAYDVLVSELSRAEEQSVLEFKQKTEEKKKVKRLEMLNTSLKDWSSSVAWNYPSRHKSSYEAHAISSQKHPRDFGWNG